MIRVLPLFLYFFLAVSAFAATDDFTITQVIGNDTTPPSTPASISPVPVTATQIDITWGVSTDDQNLTGYRLFRDAVHIATTSSNSYSDVGLTPSTTYSYTVEAYDWFFNISTTSVAAATTTLQLPVIPPTATSTSVSTVGSQMNPRLISLQVEPFQKRAQFIWDTNIYTKYVLRWGISSEYDLGFIKNEVYSRSHTTNIGGLEPGTRYMFELIGVNQLGHESLLKRGVFTTQEEKDTIAPANVSSVRTIVENDSVYIQWVNPTDLDFTKVRIVRNHLFYPRDPADGFIVYQGSSQSFFDSGGLSVYADQYYTIFAYDASGNISSGAVAFARAGGGSVGADANGSATVEDENISSEALSIDFSDVLFIQKNAVLQQIDSQVTIDSEEPLGIHIPAVLLSENLKTVIVTLTDRYDDAQSYMLRSDSQKEVYQALLRSLPEGTYAVTFTIYDYQTQAQMTFGGRIVSQKWISSNDIQTNPVQNMQTGVYAFWLEWGLIFVLLLLLLFLIWFLFIARRSREDN